MTDPAYSRSPFSAGVAASSCCALFLLRSGRLQQLGTRDSGPPLDQLGPPGGMALADVPGPVRGLLENCLAAGREVVVSALPLGPGSWWARALPLPDVTPSAALLCLAESGTSVEFDRSLRQLERLAGVGTLAAGYAHEIRNSLVAAKTFVDLLLEKNRDAELAEVVGRELRRTDALLSQMLRFAGPARAARAPLQLRMVVHHSLQMVQHQLDAKGIRLEQQLEAGEDTVTASEYELQQVLVNLLLNALDATTPGGKIGISTAPANGAPHQVQLAVRDDGAGIAPEHLGRMFEPFFTTKDGGTGLGLAIARRIVEEHHGRINVESVPGRGTTFTITLPLTQR